MMIDGKKIAEGLLKTLEKRRAAIAGKVALGVLVCGGNAATESFVRIKARTAARLGVTLRRVDVPATASSEDMIFALRALAEEVDALVVQLPLPAHIQAQEVLTAIPRAKDVDALNPQVVFDERLVHAPVAEAVEEILREAKVPINGARVSVVGAGALVGAPVAEMLRARGADVSTITLNEGDLSNLKTAQIIVTGAGSPGLIRPEMLTPGVVIIDAGTSEMGGLVVGDAEVACAEVASLMTPVPGGVGPIMIAKLFDNVLTLAEQRGV